MSRAEVSSVSGGRTLKTAGVNRDGLATLYEYNVYANHLLLDVAEQLTAEEYTRECSPSHGTVSALLHHMLECEAAFLARCQDRAFSGADLPTLSDLRSYWSNLEGEQMEYIDSLSQDDLGREISVQFGGGPQYRFLLWQLLTQAVVHSIHHRGELSIVLTHLGHPLPTTDIILHFMEQSGQQWPG